jgi:hypothetical protein
MRKNNHRPPMEDDQKDAPLDTTSVVGYVLGFCVALYFIWIVGEMILMFLWR